VTGRHVNRYTTDPVLKHYYKIYDLNQAISDKVIILNKILIKVL
jgi:hypothetical protein